MNWRIPAVVLCFFNAGLARAQLQSPAASDAVRVTVSRHEDGSRTAYEMDPANKKALATTTNAAGKTLETIKYQLDDAGRFSTGNVFGPDGQLRFKTVYKYGPNGQLLEETQLTKDGVVKLKLVYSYDGSDKQNGYSVYDGAGKFLGQTTPRGAGVTAAPPKK
ncbi:MAG: hypothetical protein H0T95_11100 [Chthoniobacterales bacterium]|jgi:hypothetical protein|nr:hypothetical protein [Chthoniobacterales bacterium]